MISRRALLGSAAASLGSMLLGCDQRPSGDRIEVDLWFSYGGRNREVLEGLVSGFNRSQPEIWVNAVYQGDYFEGLAKLRTAVAAKAAPALSHVVGEVVPYLAEAGVLEPLDSYPRAGELDVIDALGQRGSWIGGDRRSLVALPFNRSTPIAYLNRTVFERAGLSAPKTWVELREVARALTVRRGRGTERHGFGCPINWWFWVALVGQAGGQIVEPDGTVSLGGRAGVEALELWQRLARQDRTMKPPPGRDYNAWEQANQDFLGGRTAMMWTSTAFLRYLEDNAPFPVLAAALPRFRRHAVPTGGTHWVLLRDAPREHKLAAWAFVEWMHRPAQVITWSSETGYLPTTHGAVAKLESGDFYRRHPNHRVALDQLGVAQPWPWSAELFRLQREIVEPRLEQAVLEGASANRLLAEARRLAERGAP